MPKLVYLDSNDFSDLSVPGEKLRPKNSTVLDALRKAHREGHAQFVLSPALLSEAVHATAANKGDALRRASLMRELCGSNTLRYPTDICKAEAKAALANGGPVHLRHADIFSGQDEFFGAPYGTSNLSKIRQEAQKSIDEKLQVLPRNERRKLKSQLTLSKRSSRPLLRQLFSESNWRIEDEEFPLNLIDQELFLDWLLGEKTHIDLERHLRQILSDPYVMFGYVAEAEDQRANLYSIVRTGGAPLSARLEAFGQGLIGLHAIAREANKDVNLRSFVQELFSGSMLRDLVQGISGETFEHLTEREFLNLIDRCPSISTLLHAMSEYLHTLAQSNMMRAQNGSTEPTKPKPSDFGDFVHLMYAPYVDIFRCDARFGAHLARHKHVVGKIAARRRELINMLECP